MPFDFFLFSVFHLNILIVSPVCFSCANLVGFSVLGKEKNAIWWVLLDDSKRQSHCVWNWEDKARRRVNKQSAMKSKKPPTKKARQRWMGLPPLLLSLFILRREMGNRRRKWEKKCSEMFELKQCLRNKFKRFFCHWWIILRNKKREGKTRRKTPSMWKVQHGQQ